MSKRTRFKDNSKRGQPVQQQRAEAAQQALANKNLGKRSDQQAQRNAKSGER